MRVILSIVGAIIGLFAAAFLADKGVSVMRKYFKNYISIHQE